MMINQLIVPGRPSGWLALVTICWVAVVCVPYAAAQNTGTIAGTVLDGDIGETLIGANVVIEALTIGDQTDLDGKYTITNVPVGTHTVTVRYIGFATKRITDVVVNSGETTVVDVVLTTEVVGIGEVIVTADREAGSAADVLNERKMAASVIDVLDVEQISTAGGNAAAAIERVSGAEVTDGKYVQVRGFGGRYGKVTINGVPVPSISPDEKSVPLDVVSSDVLQSASVAKGWTPDLPADFAGGIVDLRTIETPPGPMLNLQVESSYNTATSFKDGLTIGGCDDTWTGFSDCFRWPESIASLPDSVGVTGEIVHTGPREGAHYAAGVTSPEQLQRVAGDIASLMPIGPSVKNLPLGQSYELSAGNRFTVGGRPFGVLGVGSYSNSFQQYQDYEYNSPGLDPVFSDVLQTEQTVRVGMLGGLSYEISESQRINATVLFNRLTEDLSRYQAGLFDPRGEQQSARTITNQRVASVLFSSQLAGQHRLFGQTTANWTVAYSRTSRLEPGTMPLQYQGPQGLDDDGGSIFDSFLLPDSLVLSSDITRKGDLATRNHFDQRDNAYLGKLDLSFPIRIAGRRVTFKTGVFADLGERIQDGHRVTFIAVGEGGVLLPDIVFSPENMVGDFVPLESFPTEPGVYVDESTAAADNYEAGIDVLAAYAMVDAEPLPGVRIVGGARITDSEQSVLLKPRHNGAILREEELPFGASYNIKRSFTDILPAISAQVNLSDVMDIRAGYGRTIGRPQFRELVPFVYEPRPGAPRISGNPELERTLIDNVDLRWSWYPVPTALFSVGGFFKHFDGPVEPLSGTGGSYINTGKANTWGAEVEIRIPGALLSNSLGAFGIRSNLALMRTKAGQYYFIQLSEEPGGPTRSILIPEGNRPLFGQTPLLFNTGLTFEPGTSGFSSTVLFRYTGEQLRYLRTGGLRTYREPLTTLDIILSKDVMRGFSIGFEARNILGNEITYITELPVLGTVIENNVVQLVTEAGDTGTQEFYDRGRTVEVSLTWTMR